MRIWVDCTAAAHPLVLRPLIALLRERGHDVSITARSYGQTEGLLERLGLAYESFGTHGGASILSKGTALAGPQRAARPLGAPAPLRPRHRPWVGGPRRGRHGAADPDRPAAGL